MNTIEVSQVCKTFKGTFQLGPLDLRVAPGEVVGIMGPDGAGKTTLLRLLWGFIRPDAGTISVFGLRPHLEQIRVRLKAGFVSQQPQTYANLTANQFLRFIGSFYEGWDEERTDEFLEQFDIEPEVPISELSPGERYKVSLISAVGHRPSLLILDEPTAGLDPLPRADVLRFLKRLARKDSVSILLSSDVSDDLDQIVDSVLMLNDGRPVEYARAAFLFEKYSLSQLEAIFVHAISDAHRPERLD